MATNKNQHFVPRCYLRQFTLGGADKAINLYNIDRDKFIVGAPVKNQCSGDYFYGKDESLEAVIQSVEQVYGSTIKKILEPKYVLTDEHREALALFWLLQHLRTEAASRRSVEMTDAMASVIGSDVENFRMQIKDAVQVAMKAFGEAINIVSDLKGVLVRNRSRTPYITSDDPAVLSNRWHLHNARETGRSFGLHSAGALLILPLSPTVLYLGYDGDVHSVPHHQGWVDLRDTADADSFNQHQYLNCRANLFVREPEHFDSTRRDYQAVSANRLPVRHRINYAVLDETDGEYSRYVVVDRDKVGDHEKALIHTETLSASPTRWPRQLTWRSGAAVYSNDTGLGYVRRASTFQPSSSPFKKVKAFL